MKKAIFENRRIEQNEQGERAKDELKFPVGTIWEKPPSCCRVKVDQVTYSLTIKNDNGKLCFTKGWKKFAKENKIKFGDAISLYEEDGHYGPEATPYWIDVKRAQKRIG